MSFKTSDHTIVKDTISRDADFLHDVFANIEESDEWPNGDGFCMSPSNAEHDGTYSKSSYFVPEDIDLHPSTSTQWWAGFGADVPMMSNQTTFTPSSENAGSIGSVDDLAPYLLVITFLDIVLVFIICSPAQRKPYQEHELESWIARTASISRPVHVSYIFL